MSHDRSTGNLHDHMGVVRATISKLDRLCKLKCPMSISGV
jgi:hypothetical protein